MKSGCKQCLLVWALLTGISLLIGGLLTLFLFTSLVNSIISSKVQLLPGSEVAEAWINPPVKPFLKVYYFNVTNPEEYLAGAKIKLQEVGPFVYEEAWQREEVQWLEKDTEVKFRLKRSFHYRADLSSGSLSDQVTLPNVPIFGMYNKLRLSGPEVLKSGNLFLKTQQPEQKIFETRSVEDVTWGYKHPLVDMANLILPEDKKLPELYGYFYGKNNSDDGEIKIFTGLGDVSKLGSIVTFDNKTEQNIWPKAEEEGQECDSIRGSDGSLFPPFVNKNQTFYIYNKAMCRSLALEFSETVSHHGLETYRFTPSKRSFSSADSSCYCPGSHCAPEGMFNVSQCQDGAPMLLSWPHFYAGEERLVQQVEGLRPSKELHEFGVDILPQLGVGLRAAIRLQINVFIEVDGIDQLANATDAFVPIVWFDDGLEELDDEETIKLLKSAVVQPAQIQSILYPVLLAVGIAITIVSLILLIIKFTRARKEATVTSFNMQQQQRNPKL